AENPAVAALVNILELATNKFRRRDVLDVLRSRYVDYELLSTDDVDLLERISFLYHVTGGGEMWLDAIAMAAHVHHIGEDDDDAEPQALLAYDDAQRLHDALRDFFQAVTPPVQAEFEDYVRWIEQLIGDDPFAEPDDEPIVADVTSDGA